MIASLPMYDRPATRAAHDALWSLIRDGLRERGIPAPDALDRAVPHMEGWARPDLVLGQICNLPYRARFRGRVAPIGAGDYEVAGCAPGYYCSLFVIRADEPDDDPSAYAGRRFAYSEPLSNSGWGAAHAWAAERGITFRPGPQTGSHAGSVAAVAAGRADIATIDAVTWGLLEAEGLTRDLRTIGRTGATPGMTFVTGAGRDPAPHLEAIAAAIEAMKPEHRAILGLRGIVALPPEAYDLPLPPDPQALAV